MTLRALALVALLVGFAIVAYLQRPRKPKPVPLSPWAQRESEKAKAILNAIWRAQDAYMAATARDLRGAKLQMHPETLNTLRRDATQPWQGDPLDGVFGLEVKVNPAVPPDEILIIPEGADRIVYRPNPDSHIVLDPFDTMPDPYAPKPWKIIGIDLNPKPRKPTIVDPRN